MICAKCNTPMVPQRATFENTATKVVNGQLLQEDVLKAPKLPLDEKLVCPNCKQFLVE